MTGKFICKTGDDGRYRFDLLACNGQVILASPGYRNRDGCLRGVDSVRRNSVGSTHFEEQSSTDGRFYFVLKAASGHVIGTSQRYASRAACRRGVASVQRHVAEARLLTAWPESAGAQRGPPRTGIRGN